MSWTKVTSKNKKPLGWWYHKVMVEISWYFKRLDKWKRYLKHSEKMVLKYRLDFYGEKINENELKLLADYGKFEKAIKDNPRNKVDYVVVDDLDESNVTEEYINEFCKYYFPHYPALKQPTILTRWQKFVLYFVASFDYYDEASRTITTTKTYRGKTFIIKQTIAAPTHWNCRCSMGPF